MNFKILILLICLSLASCGSVRTFHDYAQGGDTVAVPAGMQPTFNKDNITVTITDVNNATTILPASDPAIRAVINLYPDPLSNMVVSREIEEDTAPSSYGYGTTTLVFADDDKDYFQTTVFVDLPVGMAVGLATINITDLTGASHDSALDIIASTGGAPNSFKAEIPDTTSSFLLDDVMRDTLARAAHTEITFSASEIPYAIEMNFTHDPDKTVGGAGKAFVVNPLGYIKNLSWSDDGTNMKIIMIQSTENIIENMNDYKFYIAGTHSNLQFISADGFDINGNNTVSVIPTLTVRN